MTVKDRMRKKTVLRLISLVMLIAAVVFVVCALMCPTLGHTVYIFGYAFGAKQWRVCYWIYLVIMISLFISSFFVSKRTE